MIKKEKKPEEPIVAINTPTDQIKTEIETPVEPKKRRVFVDPSLRHHFTAEELEDFNK